MTTGNKGSRQQAIAEEELAKTRETEDAEGLKILGLSSSDSENLNIGDGQVEASLATVERLTSIIRSFKPDLVVTHNPEKILIRDTQGNYYVNHRDHRNTAIGVVDAVYPYSRDVLFFPDQLDNTHQSHTVTEFLFVDSWDSQDTVYINVTSFAQKRTQAIAAHSSQYSLDHAQRSTDYFAPLKDGKRFEQFRYVVTD